MGAVYGAPGIPEKAGPALNRALALTESEFGTDSLEYAEMLDALGGMERHERALEIRLRLLPPNDPRIAFSYWLLGLGQLSTNEQQGEATLMRGLAIAEKASPPDDRTHLFLLNDLVSPCLRRGEYERAIDLMRQALVLRERIYHPTHPDLLQGRIALGYTLMMARRYEEAARYVNPAAIAALEQASGSVNSGSLATAIHSLGELKRRTGSLEEARGFVERSLALYGKVGPHDSSVIDPLTSLGLIDEAQGRMQEALRHLESASMRRSSSPGPGLSTLDPRPGYARVLRWAKRTKEAAAIEASLRAEAATP